MLVAERGGVPPDLKGERGLQRVTVVSVPVSDQEVAKRFYTEQVGLQLRFEARFGDGQRWIQVALPGDATSLTLVTWFDAMPPGSLRGLVIDCDDLDADYAAMSARSVRFNGPPTQQAGGVFATFTDPDGNQISLRQAEGSIGEAEGLVRR
jgi:predicted enzyme related to lactoylglutathione lyase